MSVEDINRFTKDDVVCALEMFNEDYVTFPRDDIAKLSGLTMPVNKRNWRKQSEHIRLMNLIRDEINGNRDWRNKNGRPVGSGTAQERVSEWRQQHPEGRKADCHNLTVVWTGLDTRELKEGEQLEIRVAGHWIEVELERDPDGGWSWRDLETGWSLKRTDVAPVSVRKIDA